VHESDAGVKQRLTREALFHADEHELRAALIEDGACGLRAGHTEAVSLINDPQTGGIEDVEPSFLPVLQ
jgi:hypothetical protein